jgi:hypothetical protein
MDDQLQFIITKWSNFLTFLVQKGPKGIQPKIALLKCKNLNDQLNLLGEALQRVYLKHSNIIKDLKNIVERWESTCKQNITVEEKYRILAGVEFNTEIETLKKLVGDVLELSGNTKTSFSKWINDNTKPTGKPNDDMVRIELVYRLFRYLECFYTAFRIEERNQSNKQNKP